MPPVVASGLEPIRAIRASEDLWWAIVDPFRWYISGADRIVFNSHVFYPTSITFAACILLMTFQRDDTLALDTYRSR